MQYKKIVIIFCLLNAIIAIGCGDAFKTSSVKEIEIDSFLIIKNGNLKLKITKEDAELIIEKVSDDINIFVDFSQEEVQVRSYDLKNRNLRSNIFDWQKGKVKEKSYSIGAGNSFSLNAYKNFSDNTITIQNSSFTDLYVNTDSLRLGASFIFYLFPFGNEEEYKEVELIMKHKNETTGLYKGVKRNELLKNTFTPKEQGLYYLSAVVTNIDTINVDGEAVIRKFNDSLFTTLFVLP